MKITIKKRVVSSASLSPKLKVKYKMADEIVEISDVLIDKTIAVIDELLDRTWDDWEERGWTGLDFPLVPFPFFKKSRLPENIGVDDYWIGFWLDTRLQNIITERTKIIEILKEMEGIESIKHNPVINLTAPIFNGDKFELCINRSKLVSLKKLIIEKQQKIKEKDKKIKKIQGSMATQVEIIKMPELKTEGFRKLNREEIKDKFQSKNNNKNVYYQYNENEKRGILTIGQYPKIEFRKKPALIIRYFYDSKDLDKGYKSCKDFLGTECIENFSSDDFSKRISKINNKISKETKNKIKQIICKEEKLKRTEINRYRWSLMT